MNHFVSRIVAGTLLALSTIALSAHAQAVANPNQNNPNQTNPDKKQQNNPADQNKNQAPPNDKQPNAKPSTATGPSDKSAAKDNAASTQRRDKQQADRDAKNSQTPANQQNQSNAAQANPNAGSQQNAAQGSNQQKSTQNQTNQQKSADNSRQSSTAREHTAMRPSDMRGPDIGLWFNRSSRDGLVISDVSSRGPIAQLGFREGDRIVSVNGRRISGEPEFINYLLTSDADRVEVIVTRNGREETIYVEPSTLTAGYGYTQVEPLEQFGVVLDDRYDDRIVIWKVVPRSPAYYAGLREGDVISTLSGHQYKSRTEFEKSVGDLKAGETNLQVRRGDRNRDLSVDVPEFDRSAQQGSDRSTQGQRDQSNRDQGSQRDSKDRNSDDRSSNDRNSNDQNNNQRPANGNPPSATGGSGERH